MGTVTTAGFAFVEFVCPEPEALVALFGKLGFKALGQHAQTGAVLLRQNEAALIVNPVPNPFREVHGASARAIAIHVDNAANALAQALEGGARMATPYGTPEGIAASSRSIFDRTPRPTPAGRRRSAPSLACWSHAKPAGKPSTNTTIAWPCDSPAVL